MNRRDGMAQLSGRGATVLGALLTIVFVTSGPALSQTRTDAARELSKAFSSTAKAAMPAVVSIKVERTVEVDQTMGSGSPFEWNDPFGAPDDFFRRFFPGRMPQRQAPQKYTERGQGSGFIISEDGYILTNNHVVGDADKITVELQDGRKFTDAKVIGADPDSEVALIKIEGSGFPVLPMGDSDKIEIADWVIAIGNPFGLSETVTVGVISAKGRSNVHIAAYEDFIQTDAAINPGNSGGPLIDLDGKAIGINTAIYSQAGGYMGIGFAIPINMARGIQEQLRNGGKVVRGYMGLYGQNITPDLAEMLGLKAAAGIVVSQVMPDSPAEKAGLQRQDVIVEMDGKKVESYDVFRNAVAVMRPGSTVRFNLLRDGKPMELTATLGERPSAVAQAEKETAEPQESLGITVQDLTKDLAEQFKYPLGEGVIVSRVTPAGPAAREGIQAGDLILSVNGQKVNSVREFANAVRDSKSKGKVLFLIKRGEGSQFVVVPFE